MLRINHKFNFTYLDGIGWGNSAGPVVFKCDVPPQIQGQEGRQWGRNLTTGVSPGVTQHFVYDPQTGPMSPTGLVGYFDDRSPSIQSVGFDGAFQGYLESELVLARPRTTCVGTCPDYTHMTKTCSEKDEQCRLLRGYHCNDESRSCMKHSNCPSFARKCVRASRNVTICPSSDPTKAYDWLSFGNGRVLKRSTVENVSECASGPTLSALERWEMTNDLILNAPQYCELCLCTCMTSKNPKDQSYFDIQPSVADVEKGNIISALKFVKEGNVIRLAIEQGKPLPNGKIDETTLKWVDPLPFDKLDPTKTLPIGLTGFMKINLDLVIGEAGSVLTGIRFKLENNDSLTLEIQTTPISWPVDKLDEISLKASESSWKNSSTHDKAREPITFVEPGDPAGQLGPSMPDSIFSSYVEFTTTTYAADLAQTVIPFFDTQPVYHYEGRRWLRGSGLIHKGKPGSGGFLAPVIVSVPKHYPLSP